ncbi:uncharacterized protein K02A2.6-like [Gigantopelta aegis]|uniref:uncharacterized protein K02A2.6-like n=1 Tax=Gigantopelta aegis TaxID=1735272 RepID=UPI001B88D634|nr:uncharacterized protein K02A2.6-like [Gigantopelta aegis]
MANDIKDYIGQCSTCNEYESQQQKEPLLTHDVPDHSWSKLGIDIFTLHSQDCLITVDYYSDFWELDILKATSSITSIDCLKVYFSRHGIPDIVVTDNGPQLASTEFNEFAREWEFEHVTSSPYHSQSNGKAESTVKIAKKLVKKSQKSGNDLWKSILDWRNTPTEGMSSSPVQRLMSQRTRHSLPIADVLLKPQVIEHVYDNIKLKRQKAKLHYDKHAKELSDLQIGQQIRMVPLPNDRDKI